MGGGRCSSLDFFHFILGASIDFALLPPYIRLANHGHLFLNEEWRVKNEEFGETLHE
jgi:hypothetical protein